MKKTVNNIIILALLSSIGFTLELTVTDKTANISVFKTSMNEQKTYPICGTPLLIPKEQEIIDYFREHPEERALMKTAKSAWNFSVGDTHNWWASNRVTNDFDLIASTCRAVGDNCYIFVADANWEASIEMGRVDQTAVDAIVDGFDNTTPNFATTGIYDVDVTTFGEPPNDDGDPKIIILILDIQDQYSVSGTGGYIGGYFSPGNQLSVADYLNSNEAEMFYMDCNPANLLTPSGINQVLNTTAHEFQHMIHHRWDENEIAFPNEGLSEIASYVCGYGLRNDSGYRDNTDIYLFNWSEIDALPDYTRAALWTLYLLEQHPNSFLEMLVKAPLNGSDGINQALSNYGATRTWQEIFVDWLIANYLQDTSVDPRWGYAYPNSIASTPVAEYSTPNVTGNGSINRTSGLYITFKSAIPDTITWTAGANLSIKAIKIGNTTIVEDVQKGVPYAIKPNGEIYSDVTFCIINNSVYTQYNYSYEAKGVDVPVVPGNYELFYDDGTADGTLGGYVTGDSIAVKFNGLAGAKLDSIKTIFSGAGRIKLSINNYSGTNSLRGSPLINAQNVNIIESPDWKTINLTNKNIDASSDFVVSYFLGNDPYEPCITVSQEPDDGSANSFSYRFDNDDWVRYTGGNNTIFKYMIRAYVSIGGTTTLTQPTITSIVSNQGNVQLSWDASSGPVEGYNIYRSTVSGFIPDAATKIVSPEAGNKIASVGSVVTNYTDAWPSIQPNTDYFYKVSSYDAGENEEFSEEVSTTTLSISDNSGLPTEYNLDSNYPNPFNPSTTFKFSTLKDGLVKFTVHDLLGRVVYSENRNLFAGNYSFTWEGNNMLNQQVVSGVYFLRMEAEGFSQTRKMLLLR